MSSQFNIEIQANISRAEESLVVAKELFSNQHYDFCSSRAYYAAFYVATALLLREGFKFKKHGGVISAIHNHFVKTGRLDQEQGKDLSWLFQLRGVGDYGQVFHVSKDEAQEAIKVAEIFIENIRKLMNDPPRP